MVRCKSLPAAERETLIANAVLDVQSGKYRSAYHTEKVLGLLKSSVIYRVSGGLTYSQACQQQQKLSGAQEQVLLKWIKSLTISGYSPGHQLLKEIAEELRSYRSLNFDDAIPNSLPSLSATAKTLRCTGAGTSEVD
ncbi:hypothetical protein V491_00607 [Pseudogymnoascus sp. VKM F-3775]|nr:hypothetical protein V491_00607 [Pseudogymnoascus sp. VKM F-3775]